MGARVKLKLFFIFFTVPLFMWNCEKITTVRIINDTGSDCFLGFEFQSYMHLKDINDSTYKVKVDSVDSIGYIILSPKDSLRVGTAIGNSLSMADFRFHYLRIILKRGPNSAKFDTLDFDSYDEFIKLFNSDCDENNNIEECANLKLKRSMGYP